MNQNSVQNQFHSFIYKGVYEFTNLWDKDRQRGGPGEDDKVAGQAFFRGGLSYPLPDS
jgi:hypothetical protein